LKNYIKHDPWCIVEEGFHPQHNEITESLMSLGNGRMGQRGNFEEKYSGKTLQGNYVAGVYYPDKTRVGWWKNGYPEYFAKVLNAANWVGLHVELGDETLDLHTCKVLDFQRVLNMKEGYFERRCRVLTAKGKELTVHSKRINSIVDDEAGLLVYSITSHNYTGSVKITAYIDGDIKNKDSNYDEKFWEQVQKQCIGNEAYLELSTKKTNFHVLTGQRLELFVNNKTTDIQPVTIEKEKYVANEYVLHVEKDTSLTLVKYAVNLSSENHEKTELLANAKQYLAKIAAKGYQKMLDEQSNAWAAKWEHNDIQIEGDVAAQQGIRFNIFQLNQTYTGQDARLNIGPKGFTGEKYGGSTYWDTEAYCIPFYLATADQQVARNLLIYRWKQLGKAIENAQKLGFDKGAALYPMVTMNGEECHNEWEITFEEIHRNGAIAYAIHDYVRYTGQTDYLHQYGLEVLLGIARFWVQRVQWSQHKQQYVMLGVTGPNEYENNVNNNWYTSYLAVWCLKYCIQVANFVKEKHPNAYQSILQKCQYDPEAENKQMWHIIENMYLPESEELGIYLQQDGYLDKEQVTVQDLSPEQRPINQRWSWDRILRSPYIKQADVLQGLYFFEEDFDLDTIRRNYEYYEPRTVHESSLSPCVHSILAAKLGHIADSYRFYNRAARLDLDDYNNDTEDGLHITSMAGTWMSIVKGFGGMQVIDNMLYFSPLLPDSWKSFTFKVGFREQIISLKTNKELLEISNHSAKEISLMVYSKKHTIAANSSIQIMKDIK
jgi:maltose phosphorylase